MRRARVRACMVVCLSALAGSVALDAPAGAASSETSSIVAVPPTFTSFAPTSGGVGTTVTISGKSFTAPCSVAFGGVAAPCRVISGTRIATNVPVEARSGHIRVTTGGKRLASSSAFTVTLGLLLSPASGPPTTTISIHGAGYGADELLDLYVGTVDEALVTTDAYGDFVYRGFAIPKSAQPGPAWITAAERHNGMATQASFLVGTNWSGFGFGPAHAGWNPYENTVGVSNVAEMNEMWRYAAGGNVTDEPAISNGVVYFGAYALGPTYFDAINGATGKLLWSYTPGNQVYSSPSVVNGVVYFGCLDHRVYALDAATGTKIWTFTTGDAVEGSPTVVGGVLYIGSFDGSVYALNAATGAKLWSFYTQPPPGQLTGVYSSPAVVNGVVYVGSLNGSVYALDAATGTELWNYPTGGNGPVYSSPAVINGVVFVGSLNSSVYALNASTGLRLWSYTTGGPVTSSPSVVNGVVYVGSEDHNLYAINATTGAELWHYTTGTSILSSPTAANGVVYVGSEDDNVYALNATTGTELWHYTTGNAIRSSPAVANGVVYVGSVDDNLYAFHLPGFLTARDTSTAISPAISSPRTHLNRSNLVRSR